MNNVIKYKALGYKELKGDKEVKRVINETEYETDYEIMAVLIKEEKLAIIFKYMNKNYKVDMKLFGVIKREWNSFKFRCKADEDDCKHIAKITLKEDESITYNIAIDMENKIALVADKYHFDKEAEKVEVVLYARLGVAKAYIRQYMYENGIDFSDKLKEGWVYYPDKRIAYYIEEI